MSGSFGGVPCPAPGVGNRSWAIHMIGLNPSGMDGCVDPHAACRQTLKLGSPSRRFGNGAAKRFHPAGFLWPGRFRWHVYPRLVALSSTVHHSFQ